MKKMLLVLCVVMTFSMLASAKHYTVSLNDFCDVWSLTVDKGNTGLLSPAVFVHGTHDMLSRCNITNLDTIGYKHGSPATVPPNEAFGTSGPLLDISDEEEAVVWGSEIPYEFMVRVTNGCAVALYFGGDSVGGSFFGAEDGCTLSAAPQKSGLQPMGARQ